MFQVAMVIIFIVVWCLFPISRTIGYYDKHPINYTIIAILVTVTWIVYEICYYIQNRKK